jgi:hypothetical protein
VVDLVSDRFAAPDDQSSSHQTVFPPLGDRVVI